MAYVQIDLPRHKSNKTPETSSFAPKYLNLQMLKERSNCSQKVPMCVAWDDLDQWRQFLLNSWCVRNLPECCASSNRHDERKQLALHFRMMMAVVVMIMMLVMMIMDGWFLRNKIEFAGQNLSPPFSLLLLNTSV